MTSEKARFAQEVAEVERWWKVCIEVYLRSLLTNLLYIQSPRFARVTRPYTAADVVSKRGTLPIQYPSNVQGKKLFALLSEHAKKGTPSHTYGA